MTAVFVIFEVTFITPLLPAVAKDILKNTPKPNEVLLVPASTPNPGLIPSQEIISGLSGAAASISVLTSSFGFFFN